MTDIERLRAEARAAGYDIVEPIPRGAMILTAAINFRMAADRICELVGEGGRIGEQAAEQIQRAANAIHEARAKNEQREEAA